MYARAVWQRSAAAWCPPRSALVMANNTPRASPSPADRSSSPPDEFGRWWINAQKHSFMISPYQTSGDVYGEARLAVLRQSPQGSLDASSSAASAALVNASSFHNFSLPRVAVRALSRVSRLAAGEQPRALALRCLAGSGCGRVSRVRNTYRYTHGVGDEYRWPENPTAGLRDGPDHP
jgi:hypothetical protein